MQIGSTRVKNAPLEAVWKALNDPEVLQDALPGCEVFEREPDAQWRAIGAVRIGPVAARFSGKLFLADVVAPRGYTLRFEGQGGAAGFAKGDAKVTFVPAEGGATSLSYMAKAQIGGKLAQVGARLVDGAATTIADEFFARFSERVTPTPALAVVEAPATERTERALSSGMRYVSLAVIVALTILFGILALR